jgi:cell division protein FtsB
MSKLGISSFAITVTAFTGVVAFIVWHEQLIAHLNIEVFKLCFQFLLIVVLGGAVTLLFTAFTKQREEFFKQKEKKANSIKEENEKKKAAIKEDRALLLKFNNEFIEAYNGIKKVRRLVRARTRIRSEHNKSEENTEINTIGYDEQMQDLTTIQLQFEFLKDEVKSSPNLFAGSKKAKDAIGDIETYLGRIVTEYECCYLQFPGKFYLKEIPGMSLENLPELKQFIAPYNEKSDFAIKFLIPANNLLQEIKSDLNQQG